MRHHVSCAVVPDAVQMGVLWLTHEPNSKYEHNSRVCMTIIPCMLHVLLIPVLSITGICRCENYLFVRAGGSFSDYASLISRV